MIFDDGSSDDDDDEKSVASNESEDKNYTFSIKLPFTFIINKPIELKYTNLKPTSVCIQFILFISKHA